MEFGQIVTSVTNFFRGYPLLAAAVIAGLLYSLYSSPKETFKFLVAMGLLAVAIYFVMQFTGTTSQGVSGKDELIHKTERAIGE